MCAPAVEDKEGCRGGSLLVRTYRAWGRNLLVAMATGGVSLEKVGCLARTGYFDQPLIASCDFQSKGLDLTYAGGRNAERWCELTCCLAFPMD